MVALGVIIVLIGIGLFSGLLALPGYAFAPGYYYAPMFFPFGWLWIFFGLFLVFGIFRMLLWPWRWGYRRRYWDNYDSSHRILRERYAKGEITKEQYEQMSRDLDEHR